MKHNAGPIVVRTVLEDSSANACMKIFVGDVILAIDSQSIEGLDLKEVGCVCQCHVTTYMHTANIFPHPCTQVKALMRGEPDTKVKISFLCGAHESSDHKDEDVSASSTPAEQSGTEGSLQVWALACGVLGED